MEEIFDDNVEFDLIFEDKHLSDKISGEINFFDSKDKLGDVFNPYFFCEPNLHLDASKVLKIFLLLNNIFAALKLNLIGSTGLVYIALVFSLFKFCFCISAGSSSMAPKSRYRICKNIGIQESVNQSTKIP